MALSQFLDRLTLLRRLVASLERIAAAQEQTNVLLARLADHLAPVVPAPTQTELKTAGPSFGRDRDHAALQEWTDGFVDRHGRLPTEDELVAHLDEVGFPA